ncbi:MAG: sulfite oxidase-like oxidoreductase [Actinomycetota bacterium]
MGLFSQKLSDEVAARVPPGQRLVKTWPVLHVGSIPAFDLSTWDLRLFGEVEQEVVLTYEELRALPITTLTADMHCVTGWTTLDNAWTGVSFRTLAERCHPTGGARWVVTHCEQGYTSDLSMQAMDDGDVLVAWAHAGHDLTPEHGYPLRLVVPKRYAWKSAKWLRGLEFRTDNKRGFWEERGYHVHADPWPEERYSYQEHGRADLEP